MGRIPEATIEQILASTDIVELVGQHVKLRRAGPNFVGLCPFHNERTPSFNVSSGRNSYHCFGCGAGGTAIGFLMEFEGLSFVEAAKKLAQRANITIQEEVWDANTEREAKQRSSLIQVNQQIADWFHQLLLKHPLAAPARDYLKGRSINSQIAKNWKLGYVPDHIGLIRQWAKQAGFSDLQLVDAGIFARYDDGKIGNRFRHRLVFPICNDNGDVVAFSGRVLDNSNPKLAKYLNSPETPIFNKGKLFFGFHKARRQIAKSGQAVICEGQIDLVMAHEAGFQNVIAALGTGFTEHHARILKRHADEIVLCYDSDAAGFKAAQRSFQALAPTGLIVKIAALPQGDDPDSLIRREGPQAFADLIAAALEFIDFQLDFAAREPNFDQMRERVRIAEKMASNIAILDSPHARSTAIQRVAIRLTVPEADIRNLVQRSINYLKKKEAGTASPPPDSDGDQTRSVTKADALQFYKSQHPNAILLTQLALSQPPILQWLRQQPGADLFEQMPGTELLTLIWNNRQDLHQPATFSTFLSSQDRLQQAALVHLTAKACPPGDLTTAAQALHSLHINRTQHLIDTTSTQLKQPNLSPTQASQLQTKVLALRKEYLDLRAHPPDTNQLGSHQS
jgi:DNA primase